MYTLESCEQLWDEVGQHGTPTERIERARAWLPYYSYISRPFKNAPFALPENDESFPSFLIREGLVRAGDRVLDIGAGLGGDSLRFAAHGAQVTALELSGDCLEVLRRRADRLGLNTIEAVQKPWEEFEPSDRFDVSCSSLCPAICNVEELRRMDGMTKRLCCLATVMRGSCDRHRKAMMAELGIRPKGMVTELIHYFNALYLMGRQVNVRTRTVRSEYDIPREKLMEQYPIYFRIFGVPEEKSKAFLEDYLSRHAENGVLHEESVIHMALLWWKPEE